MESIHPAWWKEAVVYQIYPRSFKDSNGDGIGDLNGIREKLDYLKDLGVDVLWLNPIYQSPNVDNGYDISDYRDIMTDFGTMADFDALLADVHAHGLKLIMDLVVNHSSDQHPWFIESRSGRDNPKRDYYIWKDPAPDGGAPNNWRSCFSGSAWKYDEKTGQYYLHLFAEGQSDLNWENPEVRDQVFDMMNFWFQKGIDGFRMDVISMISKAGYADGPLCADGLYGDYTDQCTNGPRVHEYLQEMNRRVLSHYDCMTVGENANVNPELACLYAGEDRHELNMVFQFELMDVDGGESRKWEPEHPWKLTDIKKIQTRWQTGLDGKAWNSLYWNNHDQPRVVSRFGCTKDEESRVRSAKMLAVCLYLMQGTPYIYQGEELGMTDAHFTRLDQYRDLESLNAYRQRVEEAKVQSSESMMAGLAARSRDNARTPMQWDGSGYAGFTAPDAATEPWISVNPNHAEINAAGEFDDPDSVYSFYKQLVALRHNSPVVAAGDWRLIDAADPHVYAFTRELDAEKLLVVVNMSSRTVDLPREAAELTAVGIAEPNVVISTYDAPHTVASLANRELDPWEAAVIQL